MYGRPALQRLSAAIDAGVHVDARDANDLTPNVLC